MGINPTKVIKNMVVEASKDTKELFEQINEKINEINLKLDNIESKIKYNKLLIKQLNDKKDNDEEDEILREKGF